MILKLQIDGYQHQIDTTDPELLARWILEIFGRMRDWTPATRVEMMAYPSWLPGEDRHGPGRPDWVADSSIIGIVTPVRSPRELLAALSDQLDQYEAKAGR